jgi:hypothetical protein
VLSPVDVQSRILAFMHAHTRSGRTLITTHDARAADGPVNERSSGDLGVSQARAAAPGTTSGPGGGERAVAELQRGPHAPESVAGRCRLP